LPKRGLLKRGLVIKSTGSRYKVLDEAGIIHECVIKGKFRIRDIKTINQVVAGDYVLFEASVEKIGVIREIEDRKNYIIRKSPNLSRQAQIIAANIDHALLMVTIREPETQVEFIDRFLVSAEAYRIPVKILFNKTDIYSERDLKKMASLKAVYQKIGYSCFSISVEKKKNIDSIKALLKDKVTLVSGNSGVGKSSLLNIIEPSLKIGTEKISDYHKQGTHTTTFTEMHPLSFGGFIIDTPGIRGFGLTGMIREEIYHFFPEIFRISDKCRYYNCLHINEPGCAVLESFEKGEIEWFRYRSYLNIMEDNNSKYR